MAIEPTQSAAACAPGTVVTDAAEPVERAVYTLLKPFKASLDGSEIDIHGVGMRAFTTNDLPLFDQFRGQPIALAQHVVAALCDMTIEEVLQLDVEDFTMLAGDALWQAEQICTAMGLPPRYLFEPRAEGDQA